ncbi:MAG: exodeoxyribonuclease VII small subunit [bacterium]
MKSAKAQSNFRDTLEELETITRALESDDIGLDEAIIHFERGSQLATELQAQLNDAEQRIESIKLRFQESHKISDSEVLTD